MERRKNKKKWIVRRCSLFFLLLFINPFLFSINLISVPLFQGDWRQGSGGNHLSLLKSNSFRWSKPFDWNFCPLIKGKGGRSVVHSLATPHLAGTPPDSLLIQIQWFKTLFWIPSSPLQIPSQSVKNQSHRSSTPQITAWCYIKGGSSITSTQIKHFSQLINVGSCLDSDPPKCQPSKFVATVI